MKVLEVGQPESDDLPADEMSHLGKSGPNKVDGQALCFLDRPAGETCLLDPVEDGEGAGVEEGEVAQLALLVTWQLVRHQLPNLLLKEALYAGWQGLVSRLDRRNVLLHLVPEGLLVLVVLKGGLKQVAPLLVALFALLNVVGVPGDAVAPCAVLQQVLLSATLAGVAADTWIVAQVQLVLFQVTSKSSADCVDQAVPVELLGDVLHPKRLHKAADRLAEIFVVVPVCLLVFPAEVTHLQ